MTFFRLSASKMTYFRAISVNRAFIKGLTKGFIKGMFTWVYGCMGDLRPGETGVVRERRRRRRGVNWCLPSSITREVWEYTGDDGVYASLHSHSAKSCHNLGSWVSPDVFLVRIGIYGSAKCSLQMQTYLCTFEKGKFLYVFGPFTVIESACLRALGFFAHHNWN